MRSKIHRAEAFKFNLFTMIMLGNKMMCYVTRSVNYGTQDLDAKTLPSDLNFHSFFGTSVACTKLIGIVSTVRSDTPKMPF